MTRRKPAKPINVMTSPFSHQHRSQQVPFRQRHYFYISSPRKPKRIDAAVDDVAYWHSATFNNDGTKVLFTDEWGGGSRPRCRSFDPLDWGANAIYDIVDNKLEYRSHQDARSTTRGGKLCRSQRLSGSRPRSRYFCAGLVSGRYVILTSRIPRNLLKRLL